MGALAMIESSSTTTLIEPKSAPPPYTEGDEKGLLLADTEAELSDVEITVIEHKPITAKIHTTMGHLQKVGGFFARWRGLAISTIYHCTHGFVSTFISELLGLGLVGSAVTYVLTSVCLARMHMAWTHAMITYPDSKRCFRYVPGVKSIRPLLLPSFIYAAAEQVTIILPIAVAFALGVVGPEAQAQREAIFESGCPRVIMMLVLRTVAVPVTFAIVGLAVLFPASVALTRIEASLLPEGEETIVPFDKAAITGDIDMNARGASRRLFVQAWRSFDRASRWRVVKLYTKMAFAQFVVMLVTIHVIIFEVYCMGPERLAVFFRSASAQLKLEAMHVPHAEPELPSVAASEWTIYDSEGNEFSLDGTFSSRT